MKYVGSLWETLFIHLYSSFLNSVSRCNEYELLGLDFKLISVIKFVGCQKTSVPLTQVITTFADRLNF